MELIHKNPFRILGLPVDSTERHITKRISDLETAVEFGKRVSYDSDFPFLSFFERTPEVIREAANRIETAESRFFYSLFWFWNSNSIDELALDVLKEGNVDKALKLLEGQINNSSQIYNRYSTAKNLSILYLALSRENGSYNFEIFSKGMLLAGMVLDKLLLDKYSIHLTGYHFKNGIQNSVDTFIEEVVKTITPHIDKPDGIALPNFLALFSSFPEDKQRQVCFRFVRKQIKNIEDAILLSETSRKKSPGQAYKAGDNLYEKTKADMAILKDILPSHDIHYQSSADKLANEFRNCSIDYYNYHINNNTDIDPGEDALKLAKYAQALAVSLKLKQDLDEGISILKEWIDGKDEREKQKQFNVNVKLTIDYVVKAINNLPDTNNANISTINNLPQITENLIIDCKPRLISIKFIDTDLYLKLSSAVANRALGLCIDYANLTQDMLRISSIMLMIGELDMEPAIKLRYSQNLQVMRANISAAAAATKPPASSGGCYIATMVYGSYDAPELQLLHRFRDNVLAKYTLGRGIIRGYYKYSPGFVERYRNNRTINVIARYLLDSFVRRLK